MDILFESAEVPQTTPTPSCWGWLCERG